VTFNLKNRQRLLVVLAGLAVALLAGDRFLFRPLTSVWKKRSEEITKLRDACARGAQLLKREDAIQSWWEARRPYVLTNDASAAQAQLCGAIDRWAQESRVTITSVKPQYRRIDNDAAVMECRVDSAGDLGTLTRFLYNLESDPQAIRIQDLNLTARDDSGQQITLALQLSGLILNPRPTP